MSERSVAAYYLKERRFTDPQIAHALFPPGTHKTAKDAYKAVARLLKPVQKFLERTAEASLHPYNFDWENRYFISLSLLRSMRWRPDANWPIVVHLRERADFSDEAVEEYRRAIAAKVTPTKKQE
jgi:hypothetical protein